MSAKRVRVRVANVADGGLYYWLLKLYAFAGCCLVAAGVGSLPLLYLALAARSPKPPDLAGYGRTAPLVTTIHTAEGSPLMVLAKERRVIARFEDVPKQLVRAFLAAEDSHFFEHGGVDLRGVIRAAYANLRAGRVRQGGSTITQQVAKTVLSPERTIERKLTELVLSRRLEARFSKEQILTYYLNKMYFGSGNYGVRAAAQGYFGKNLNQLSLSEMALIAGLVQAPSRYSPRRSLKRAKERRNFVLTRMRIKNFISDAQYAQAIAEPIRLAPSFANAYLWTAPHFAEYVRRDLVQRYGKDRVYSAGWQVSTTVDLGLQSQAREQTVKEVGALDRRQGWRGPVKSIRDSSEAERVLERANTIYQPAVLQRNRPYLALVESVTSQGIGASIGYRKITVPLSLMRWAAPYSRTDPTNDKTIKSALGVANQGDLIWVISPPRHRSSKAWGTVDDRLPVMALDQRPHVEGAMFGYDYHTGYVLITVGGLDYDKSSFNRTTQACRQPGSAFKPIYYSLALNGTRFSMGTRLQDRAYVPEPGEEWNPQNVHGTLEGEVSLHYALIKSLNLPSIQLLKAVGPKRAAAWARRLGLTSDIIADKGLALGASCVYMDEITRAFATFARGGTQRDPVYIRQIQDRQGQIIEDHTHPHDPWLSEDARLDRLWATSANKPKRIIGKTTAFLITKLLRDSVLQGIAARCRIVPVPTAGKSGSTGTTAVTSDVWFVGFSSQWAVGAWIGDDTYQRSLGREEASYGSVIPLWANFMKRAVGSRPHKELPAFTVKGLRTAVIDAKTGGPRQPDRPAVKIYYRPGSFTPVKASDDS